MSRNAHHNTDKIRKLLAKQLDNPIRFAQQVESMYESGVRTFIETGPGPVLTGLVNQCLEGREYLCVNLDKKNEHGITSLWKALGQLAINGVSINFTSLWENFAEVTDPREKEKPKIFS